jgi:hypothetical protein
MQLCFFTLCLPYASLRHILLDSRIYLMMQVTYDRWSVLVLPKTMCSTSLSHPSVVGKKRTLYRVGKHLPPPSYPLVSLEQLLATQNELMRMLVENDARCGASHLQHPRHQDMDLSYSDFLENHPLFSKPTDLLEVDSWLSTAESKFGLLHCTKY